MNGYEELQKENAKFRSSQIEEAIWQRLHLLREKILKSPKTGYWVAMIVTLLFISKFFLNNEADPTNVANKEEPTDVTTYIPRGFVLAPIEVSNQQALDGILADKGYVDLFQTSQTGQPSSVVATSVKMIRAPLNPKEFAVLINESSADFLKEKPGPYFVVIRGSTNQDSSQWAKKTKKIPPRIEYAE